ncbi:unnamed protein product [Trichogramma brassicae]|uniref:Uncharacterized protein n=1 Tax=Trichogramma brassicae TaxID=86971 RepID=A0A6H5J7P8_9HYME|nr:unnamed protein product [Trichogramma brassicae]
MRILVWACSGQFSIEPYALITSQHEAQQHANVSRHTASETKDFEYTQLTQFFFDRSRQFKAARKFIAAYITRSNYSRRIRTSYRSRRAITFPAIGAYIYKPARAHMIYREALRILDFCPCVHAPWFKKGCDIIYILSRARHKSSSTPAHTGNHCALVRSCKAACTIRHRLRDGPNVETKKKNEENTSKQRAPHGYVILARAKEKNIISSTPSTRAFLNAYIARGTNEAATKKIRETSRAFSRNIHQKILRSRLYMHNNFSRSRVHLQLTRREYKLLIYVTICTRNTHHTRTREGTRTSTYTISLRQLYSIAAKPMWSAPYGYWEYQRRTTTLRPDIVLQLQDVSPPPYENFAPPSYESLAYSIVPGDRATTEPPTVTSTTERSQTGCLGDNCVIN